jgi:hypothetical protein
MDGCKLIALASDAADEARSRSVAGLIEPFATHTKRAGHRHQYLGQAGPATVIISTSDHW